VPSCRVRALRAPLTLASDRSGPYSHPLSLRLLTPPGIRPLTARCAGPLHQCQAAITRSHRWKPPLPVTVTAACGSAALAAGAAADSKPATASNAQNRRWEDTFTPCLESIAPRTGRNRPPSSSRGSVHLPQSSSPESTPISIRRDRSAGRKRGAMTRESHPLA
jgi:hypothetical protein